VEKGGTIIELTRHGKKVAVVQAVATTASPVSLAGWIGSGKGTVTYAPGYDPAAPASPVKYRHVGSLASRKA
jgi:hypothetical protein